MHALRTFFLLFCLGALLEIGPGPASAATACEPWARWTDFKTTFVSPDGRVIDLGQADGRTVSEGQGYGLFFALVANDRATFDKILGWTQANLAQGSLALHLPAWLWGHKQDGSWGVIDANAASDADVWIAYTLLQAGRAWRDPRLSQLGAELAQRIVEQETADLPGLGLTLLPGPQGFRLDAQTWRLNPSYSPIQLLRGIADALQAMPAAKPAPVSGPVSGAIGGNHPGPLASASARANPAPVVPSGAQPWRQLAASAQIVLTHTAPHGFAPDWAQYRVSGDDGAFEADKRTAALGSYDAIRVYLWAGMLAPQDPAQGDVLSRLHPMLDYVAEHGYPPEKIDTITGAFGPHAGPAGMSAAIVPFLVAAGAQPVAQAQLARIADLEAKTPSPYYGQALTLFGLGWYEGRFGFDADGSLKLAWC